MDSLGFMGEVGSMVFNISTLAWPLSIAAFAPRGKNQPVVTIPGLGSGDDQLMPINGTLRLLGYKVYPSGIINDGCPETTVAMLAQRIWSIGEDTGTPPVVVGYSMGAVQAAVLARRVRIAGAILIAGPLRGGKVHPMLSDGIKEVQRDIASRGKGPDGCWDTCNCSFSTDLEEGLPEDVRIVCYIASLDSLVERQSCRGEGSNCVNVEVLDTHLGIPYNGQLLLDMFFNSLPNLFSEP